MASQTSDTANGLLSLCLPLQGCQLILLLLLKVIPVVPSPPLCVPEPLLPACLTPRPAPGAAQGHSFTPGVALEEPLSLQPQYWQEVKPKPSWTKPTNLTAGVSGKEPSNLSCKFVFPAGRSPLAQASSPCARAVVCCVSTDAHTGFADLHLGDAPMWLLGCSQAARTSERV